MSVRKRSTLSDVARRAGVSVTTASYILNGRSEQMRISPATDSRVRRAMAELDYHPNWSARSLRRESTLTLGFVSDQIAGGAFASELLTGANAEARQRGHLLVIGETQGDPEVLDRLLRELVRRQVDGMVFATLSARVVRVPEQLRGTRTVLLNCEDPDSGLAAVLPDDRSGGRLAAELVLAHGGRGSIHVVGEDPSPDTTAGPDRVAGLAEALAEAGREPGEPVPCPWEVVAARDALISRLASGWRPGTLVCLNDRIAFGAYEALARAGLRVPDDVGVVSFDGSDLAGWLDPPVTSLRLPLAEMGRRAVALLLDEGVSASDVERLPLSLAAGESLR